MFAIEINGNNNNNFLIQVKMYDIIYKHILNFFSENLSQFVIFHCHSYFTMSLTELVCHIK